MELSLFGDESFNASELVSNLLVVDDLLSDDLDAMDDVLQDTLTKISIFQEDIDFEINNLRDDCKTCAADFSKDLSDSLRRQVGISRNFHDMEKTFRHSAEVVGSVRARLLHLESQKARAEYARLLLKYYNRFHIDREDPFSEFNPAEAAPIIRDLEKLGDGFDEETAQLIQSSSDSILKLLLDKFDLAHDEGNLSIMRECADAILENFGHKQGPESLFQRFAYYSLSPLINARHTNVSYKLTAIQEHLALLFGQMRTVVRTRYEVVSRVFPNKADDVMAILVTRLFNDSLYGLQPMIQSFLHPPHQEFSHFEYLQVLTASLRHAEILVQELIKGLTAAKEASEQVPSTKRHSMGQRLHNDVVFKHMRFDVEFIRKQMKSVTRQFTRDYSEREEMLFVQRISKSIHALFPLFLLEISSPKLIKPPGLVEKLKLELETKREAAIKSNTLEAFEKQLRKERQLKEDAIKLFKSDPVAAIEENFKDFDVSNVVVVTSTVLQFPDDWQSLFDRATPEKLFEMASWNAHSLCQALGMKEETNQSDSDSGSDAGSDAGEEKSFTRASHNMRGVQGQIIRWAFEAHSRGEQLLRNTAVDRSSSVLLQNRKEDNSDMFNHAAMVFRSLCDHLVGSVLIPMVALVNASLPPATSVKQGDADFSYAKAFADDQADQMFDVKRDQYEVVGLSSEMKESPTMLPLLASNHPQIKMLAKKLSTEKLRGCGPVPLSMKLAVLLQMEIRVAIENLLLFWRDVTAPSLTDCPNRASECFDYMQQYLKTLRDLSLRGMVRIRDQICLEMQATALALHDKLDYSPKDSVVDYRQTEWSKCCVTVANKYLRLCMLFSDSKVRDSALVFVAILMRDVLLGVVGRSKISMQGSFILAQDMNAFHECVSKNIFLAHLKIVTSAWDAMRTVSQLFLVQHENLDEFIASENGAVKWHPRFVYDCISCRSDFRTKLGTKSNWAKDLFKKK